MAARHVNAKICENKLSVEILQLSPNYSSPEEEDSTSLVNYKKEFHSAAAGLNLNLETENYTNECTAVTD